MPIPVLARRLHAAVRYLLLARFGADIAAALPAALPVDIGTLTVLDASTLISQSGGNLLFNGTFGALSGINSASAFARVAGRALVLRVSTAPTLTSGTPRLGWAANAVATDVSLDIGLNYSSATVVRPVTVVTAIDSVTIGAAPHDFAFLMRATGGFLLARAGGSGPYALLWVYNTTATAEYAKVGVAATNNVVVRVDDLRVTDLGAPWNSDYGIATTRLVSPPANTTLYPHTADFVLEFSFTYTAGQTTGMAFRTHTPGQTADNWRCYASGGGTLVLDQNVASTPTNRIAVTTTFSDTVAYRVVVIAVGTTYSVYVNDVLKGTYTDAGNFQTTETSGYVAFVGSPITETVFWPRRIDLPSGV